MIDQGGRNMNRPPFERIDLAVKIIRFERVKTPK